MSARGHQKIVETIAGAKRRFGTDSRGNVALLFGLSATMIFTAMGAGLDLSRAYLARQKLSQVATMACQYASRPAIIDTSTASYNGSGGGSTYSTSVNGFINTTWQTQKVNLTQTQSNPFTYTQGGAANVSLAATVPTTFMQIAGFQSIPIAVQTHCYDTPGSIKQNVPDSSGQYVLKESFEAGGPPGSYTFYKPNGTTGTQTVSTAYTSATGYTGADGTQWHITGFCLEQDAAGVIKSNVADGNFSVELDCDNGSGTKGNSSITTLTYMAAGSYELRYNYASRVSYPNYGPTYLCASTASDLSWANDTTAQGGPLSTVLRTNQMNVYFDLNDSSINKPPVHSTIDGTQQLDGSNLIDMCVYSYGWVERSVDINVTTPGYYWLTFAGDGTSESYGAQLDYIRLCRVSCPGTVQDNFPTAWAGNKVIFNDKFESPTYTQDTPNPHYIAKAGNLSQSTGTSGTASSGWPNETATGWATAPYNQVNYGVNGAAQGSQHILLDGYNSNGTTNRNRLVSRKFYLDPGYYKLDYYYISIVSFGLGGGASFCWNMPASGFMFGAQGAATGTIRYYNTIATDGTTNVVAAFMSHGSLVSTPIAGGALNSQTSYTNPDGTTSTTPTVPPDNVNYAAYNASAINPLLDACGYADNYQWLARSANIKITKPGPYWLTFSANGGTSDGNGGGIDDVKVTALGSLYMASPPTSVTIPVPSPQPGATVSYTGFSIVADQLTP